MLSQGGCKCQRCRRSASDVRRLMFLRHLVRNDKERDSAASADGLLDDMPVVSDDESHCEAFLCWDDSLAAGSSYRRRLHVSARVQRVLHLWASLRRRSKRQTHRRSKNRGALSLCVGPWTPRTGVHLGKKGDKYVSSHNIDQTGRQFYPESINEGFAHLQWKLSSEQLEKLAELIQLSESQSRLNESYSLELWVVLVDGAPSIFHWEVHHVLTKGDYEHPKNKVVKMRVFMRELQRKHDLSDDAVQHIIQIVEHRYDSETGLLTLASQKYPKREDNRREVMRIVDELVKEGRQKFPMNRPRGSYVGRRYPKGAKKSEGPPKEESEQEIKEFFAMVDVDGDGSISLNDWRSFFQESGMDVDDSALEDVMLFADRDGDGCLNLEEFTQALVAVCHPDSSSKSKKDYILKQRALVFPFSNPSL